MLTKPIRDAINLLEEAGFTVVAASEPNQPDPTWNWTTSGFNAVMAEPEEFDEANKFYTLVKESGLPNNPAIPRMEREEYDYWNRKAIEEATTWLADNATPAPAPANGMGPFTGMGPTE